MSNSMRRQSPPSDLYHFLPVLARRRSERIAWGVVVWKQISILLYIASVICCPDMDAKVTQVTLVVKDQAAALEFYTKKVGFEKKTDYSPPGGNRWVTVGPKGQELELALFQVGTPDPNGWSSQWRPGTAPPIVLRVDDCRKAFAELRSQGVEFKQAQPEEYPWGLSATFVDPDGNLFSMNQPPAASSWK